MSAVLGTAAVALGLAAAILGTYATWVIRRRKALARLLPPGDE